jgi:hypothetical protein
MKRQRRRLSSKPRLSPSILEHINPHAAGIDCGSAEHFVAVPPDRDTTPVRSFATFTADLQSLADWLTACRVTSVAMEATHHLAEHRDYRCRASKAEIVAALTGNYRAEHVFVLRQNLEVFDYVQPQLAACDAATPLE